MSWSSLPDYPKPSDRKITAPAVVDQAEISLRSTYRYTDLLKLIAIVVLLCWLGWLRNDIVRSRTPPPASEPPAVKMVPKKSA